MPSKKRKYNARFPAGRIKKIMQTDEEVGKVAQAVPIIISTPRTLELFVESLLKKAMQVTMTRNAKTLSPSHVKTCILAEARFDFLKDLVKNIPDVSAAEEKEVMSAESSPNSSRFADMTAVARRIARADSNSSSCSDIKIIDSHSLTSDIDGKPKIEPKLETITSESQTTEAIDLSKRNEKPRMANFYQETFVETVAHQSVIQVNPIYNCPQPSTSNFGNAERIPKLDPLPKQMKPYYVDVKQNNNMAKIPHQKTPLTPSTPKTPILNIDFTKNFANPEIKVLDMAAANIVGVKDKNQKLQRQNSKAKTEFKKDAKPILPIENIGYGNLQIDEDYDT